MRSSETTSAAGYVAIDGRVTLGPDLLEVVESLERRFRDWAARTGAIEMRFPTTVAVADLDGLDYFRNFPHLGALVTRLGHDRLGRFAAGAEVGSSIDPSCLDVAGHVLQPAACYNAYLHFRDQGLPATRFVSTVGECFRNEDHYDGLTRLWGFHLREIICLGSSSDARSHLDRHKVLIGELADDLDLDLRLEGASDPFFDTGSESGGRRRLMQQLFPSKEEFLTPDGVAIASVNFHRNFFGERCDISDSDGRPVFTSCVGFGIERWLHALLSRYEGDLGAVKRVSAAAAQAPTG